MIDITQSRERETEEVSDPDTLTYAQQQVTF